MKSPLYFDDIKIKSTRTRMKNLVRLHHMSEELKDALKYFSHKDKHQ